MDNSNKKQVAGLAALLAITTACVILLNIVYYFTNEQIYANRKAVELGLITELIQGAYENDPLEDMIIIKDGDFFNGDANVGIYRARNASGPLGLVFMPVIANGYNGPISLAIGITYAGQLTGVRIQSQSETEGLGDRIHQDNSDWIQAFNGLSLTSTTQDAWAVKSDGGGFDQLSGATISPRGVIRAVKNTLDYYDIYKQELY